MAEGKGKKKGKGIRGTLADADGVARLVTGKSLAQLAGKGWDLFGDELIKALIGGRTPTLPEDPLAPDYEFLGVSPNCSDRILRAVYKSRAQEVHPDTGGSVEEFKKVDEAMDRICKARGIRK
jgi:hypothetical protein